MSASSSSSASSVSSPELRLEPLGDLLVKSYDEIVATGLRPSTAPIRFDNPTKVSKRPAKKPKKARARKTKPKAKPAPAPEARFISRPQSFAKRGYGAVRAEPPPGFYLFESNLDFSEGRMPVPGKNGMPLVVTRELVGGVEKVFLVEVTYSQVPLPAFIFGAAA